MESVYLSSNMAIRRAFSTGFLKHARSVLTLMVVTAGVSALPAYSYLRQIPSSLQAEALFGGLLGGGGCVAPPEDKICIFYHYCPMPPCCFGNETFICGLGGGSACKKNAGVACTKPGHCGGTCDAAGACAGGVPCAVPPMTCNPGPPAQCNAPPPPCPAGTPICPTAAIPLGQACGNQCCPNATTAPVVNPQPCANGNLCQGFICTALPPACPAGMPICPTVAIPVGQACGNQCCPNATTAPVVNPQPCANGNLCQGNRCMGPTCAAQVAPACAPGTCAPGTGICQTIGSNCQCIVPSCGDGVCFGSETQSNCCRDCNCPTATPVCNTTTNTCQASSSPPVSCVASAFPTCGGTCPAGGSCHSNGTNCTCSPPTTVGVTTFPMLGVTGGGVFLTSTGCAPPGCLAGMGLGAGVGVGATTGGVGATTGGAGATTGGAGATTGGAGATTGGAGATTGGVGATTGGVGATTGGAGATTGGAGATTGGAGATTGGAGATTGGAGATTGGVGATTGGAGATTGGAGATTGGVGATTGGVGATTGGAGATTGGAGATTGGAGATTGGAGATTGGAEGGGGGESCTSAKDCTKRMDCQWHGNTEAPRCAAEHDECIMSTRGLKTGKCAGIGVRKEVPCDRDKCSGEPCFDQLDCPFTSDCEEFDFGPSDGGVQCARPRQQCAQNSCKTDGNRVFDRSACTRENGKCLNRHSGRSLVAPASPPTFNGVIRDFLFNENTPPSPDISPIPDLPPQPSGDSCPYESCIARCILDRWRLRPASEIGSASEDGVSTDLSLVGDGCESPTDAPRPSLVRRIAVGIQSIFLRRRE